MLNLMLLLSIVLLFLPISLKKVVLYNLIGGVILAAAYSIENAAPFRADTKELFLQCGLLYFIVLLGVLNLFLFFFRFFKERRITLFCGDMKFGNEKKKDTVSQREYEVWMDVLKILSAIMIVCIHSSGSIYRSYFGEEKIWLKALLVHSIPRFAVPCFFMISGIVLLRREYTLRQVARKIVRVMIPLVFWSIVSILLRKVLWNEGNVIRDILFLPFRRADGAMWYAYQLIWIYLSLPVLTKIEKALSYQEKRYFIGVTLLLPSGINYMIQQLALPVEPVFSSTNLYITVQYWGLLFLGKYLYDRYAERKIPLWKSGLMVFAGILWITGGTYILSIQKGSPVYSFFEELSLPVLLYGSGVLLFVYSLKEPLKGLSEYRKKVIRQVASVSLGIYFMHCLVMWIFYSFTIGGIRFSIDYGIYSTMLCVSCYYLISLTVSFLMKQIPGVRYLVI